MDRSTLKVIIINRSQMLRTIIRDSLRKAGFRDLKSTDSGSEGLRLAKAAPPDIMIVDYSLADMNGMELLTNIRKDHGLRNTPIIMITSEPERKKVALAAECRVNALVVKPFSHQTLIDKINLVLEQHINPAEGLSCYREANDLMDEGRIDEALEKYRSALNATQYSMAAIYFRIGKALEKRKREDEAETNYLSAIRRSDRYVDAFDALGDISLKKEDMEGAANYFGKSTDLSPLNAERQLKYGEALFSVGELEGAENAYKKCMDLDPLQRSYLVVKLGISAWRQDRLEEARDYFLEALEVMDDEETIHFNLAQCYIDLGEKESALKHLKRAIKLKPDFHEARYLMVQISQ